MLQNPDRSKLDSLRWLESLQLLESLESLQLLQSLQSLQSFQSQPVAAVAQSPKLQLACTQPQHAVLLAFLPSEAPEP